MFLIMLFIKIWFEVRNTGITLKLLDGIKLDFLNEENAFEIRLIQFLDNWDLFYVFFYILNT